MGDPQKLAATPNADCTAASPQLGSESSLQPLPTAQVPRLEIRWPSAAAGRLPPPALARQGAPSSKHSPTGRQGGGTSKKRVSGQSPGTWSSGRHVRLKQRDKVGAAPSLGQGQPRAWVGPDGGRRRRAAVPSPASEHPERLRCCCIVLHHGEDTGSHPSCQKRISHPKSAHRIHPPRPKHPHTCPLTIWPGF